MKVNKNWWKNFFNEVYLITDARSVCNSNLTCREVDLAEKMLDLNKNDRILDLCGGNGRHSLELSKRGYKDITVLDYSSYLIRLGKDLAKKSDLNVKFIKRDARFTKLKSGDYSVVFIMANSFGYFPNDKENLRVLKEINRLLKKGGRLLLDLTDASYVKNKLKPASWHEANEDVIVCRERKYSKGLVKAREMVVSKKTGIIRDGYYCERIYSKEKIYSLLRNAGFKKVFVRKNLSLHKVKKKDRDYGFLNSRMFVTAVRN